MTRTKAALGCAGILAYMVLLSAGILMDSKPYRDLLLSASGAGVAVAADQPAVAQPAVAQPFRGHAPIVGLVGAFVAAMCVYTPINVAFLAMLAGFLGGCASQITYNRTAGASLTEIQATFRTENPVASMVRSFVVYLAFIAGVYVATTEPFASVSADQYLRLAGTISFFAFVVGYDPTKFQEWLGRIPSTPTK